MQNQWVAFCQDRHDWCHSASVRAVVEKADHPNLQVLWDFMHPQRMLEKPEETDPDKLHDLQANLDGAQVYSPEQIDDFVQRYLDDDLDKRRPTDFASISG